MVKLKALKQKLKIVELKCISAVSTSTLTSEITTDVSEASSETSEIQFPTLIPPIGVECGKTCRFVEWIEDTIHIISGYFDNLVSQ